MNRTDFQSLAIERLLDADALFTAGRYAGAYYVSGYAIECALKARIARKTEKGDFPTRHAPKYYTHNLEDLMKSAGLVPEFEEEKKKDSAFEVNWAIVKDWTEEARYESCGQQQAEEILAAVKDPEHGVPQWLKRNW